MDRSKLDKKWEGALSETWKVFRRGHWTRKVPKEEGLWGIAARDGGFRGYVEVYRAPSGPVYRFGDRISQKAHVIHSGWWWSRPVPFLPGAPPW